jgi:hypothetical protein
MSSHTTWYLKNSVIISMDGSLEIVRSFRVHGNNSEKHNF